MSTMSMQQPSAKFFDQFPASQSTAGAPAKTPTELLIEASDLQATDHVLVVGRSLSDHLIGLAHVGCLSAIGATPDSRFLRMEDADVVWFVDVTDIETDIGAALRDIGNPRLIAIELLAVDDLDGLQRVLRRLTAKGLVHCACHQGPGRLVVTVFRPKWLRWVA
jgi:hypothetical protein